MRQFLGDLNILLGGGASIISITDLATNTIVADLNASFSAGQPSQFAQDHLVAPAAPVCTQPSNTCVIPVPEPSSAMLLGAALLGLMGLPRLRRC